MVQVDPSNYRNFTSCNYGNSLNVKLALPIFLPLCICIPLPPLNISVSLSLFLHLFGIDFLYTLLCSHFYFCQFPLFISQTFYFGYFLAAFSSFIFCQIFFLYQNKIKIFNFVIFLATKKVGQQIFPPSLLLLLFDPGSGMDKNQDPEQAFRIRNTGFHYFCSTFHACVSSVFLSLQLIFYISLRSSVIQFLLLSFFDSHPRQ